mmetsp:Transcript_38064/g.72966  ORF Transcript_38064/g.72966 Transcript_38064/m.72966 type:complete len:244 (-) Transcript_38064:345-1076(-)|eukprot:CAMPEP_0114252528 /NCGR_PEP_ID=MMETSP0058-20121206/15886_1 /TAXON_ID=36894 /ORGANISM="Pyramimonas parkeae, CCMP726" /LENGTH=243 /DNA_ID=CAMNT_0001366471 /DNA_START=74 /DNA_END=805 /DNA_ORIENTATION=-
MASPGDWYADLPPISKIFGTSCVLVTVAVATGIANPAVFILDWGMVLYKFQIWRLVANFVFLGGFGIPFVIRIMMIARYGVFLEKTTFEGRTADFAFMLIFGMVVFLATGALIPPLYMPVGSASLVFMLVYVWARHNPDQNVNLMGIFQLKAFWLPWALMMLTVLMGGSPMADLMGILVGHLYYFLTVLHPRAGGGDYVKTPQFLTQFINNTYGGYGFVNSNYQPPRAAPRAFQGRGRRLGDN